MLLAIDLSHDAIADLLADVDDDDLARLAGRIVGMVTYEVAEGVALASATAGAGVAVKALKAERLILKLKKVPGLKNSDVVRNAVDKISFRVGKVVGTRMCFVAGTKVHTERGLADIENIRPGDLVLSRPQTGTGFASTELKPVLQTFDTHPDTLYHLTIRTPDGAEERLSTTGPHPFFVIGRHEFVMAQDLRIGDELSLFDGAATLVAIAIEEAGGGESFTTYNFEVTDYHTYFVGKLGAWVHNTGEFLCERMALAFDTFVDPTGRFKLTNEAAWQKLDQFIEKLERNGKLTSSEAGKHRADAILDLRERYGWRPLVTNEGIPGTYDKRIRWGIRDVDVRLDGPGFWGTRLPQPNARVDAYEQLISPNNESFYLPHPGGGYVQFENIVGDVLQDGKLVMRSPSIYHVAAQPPFAQKSVLAEAQRQLEAAQNAGLSVEWLISDSDAVNQIGRLFQDNGFSITVRHLAE